MGASDADRTLFVGNLDPRATEELLFELFLQAGPATNVKIPKDKDGKPKQFAFVNFRHEESVPYGMSLLNGIKLFGRPLKIQFRSGSSHLSPDPKNDTFSPQRNDNGASATTSPSTNGNSRYDSNANGMKYGENLSPVSNFQRSYSSPDNLQRQAMLNSFLWQHSPYATGAQMSTSPGFSSSSSSPLYSSHYTQTANQNTSRLSESTHDKRKSRGNGFHPYLNEGQHYRRDHYYRGNLQEHYDERSSESRSYEHRKGSRWHATRN
ncbi:RNA-binding protein 7 [Pelodytes ibericus]